MSESKEPWNSVDKDPGGPNRILWVYDERATFDTRKQRLMYYRKEDGFPPGVTYWMEKHEPPKEYQE